jgi:superfamily II DNA or RNA helicase
VIDGRVPVSILNAIDQTLTYHDPQAFFTWQYKQGLDDGKRRLLDRGTQSFPAGLEQRVLSILDDLDVEIVDERPVLWETPPEPVTRLHGYREREPKWIDLEPDQIDALRAFLDNPRGCLALPTSAGKTEIAAALFKTLGGLRCLFIVDRKGLLSQARERLQGRLQEAVGRIGGGFWETENRVTVATIQSLWDPDRGSPREKARQFFDGLGVLCVDEAHSISPNTWFQTLKIIPAPIRLGLSATIKEAPRRMVVESFLGPIVHEQEISELIELGRAATPNLAMLRMGGSFDDNADSTWAYWNVIVNYEQRNQAIVAAVKRCIDQKKPVVTLCVRIPHGHIIQARLALAGVTVPFMHGGTPLPVFDRAKSEFEAERIPALIISTIGDKGQDLPAMRGLIIAGAQRSALLTTQRAGRGMRKKWTGENSIDILDFMDMGHRNSYSQSKDRYATYNRKKLNPRVIQSLDEW